MRDEISCGVSPFTTTTYLFGLERDPSLLVVSIMGAALGMFRSTRRFEIAVEHELGNRFLRFSSVVRII